MTSESLGAGAGCGPQPPPGVAAPRRLRSGTKNTQQHMRGARTGTGTKATDGLRGDARHVCNGRRLSHRAWRARWLISSQLRGVAAALNVNCRGTSYIAAEVVEWRASRTNTGRQFV
jgi:hypothetical protein